MDEFLKGDPDAEEIDEQLAKMQFSTGIAAHEKICLYFFSTFDESIVKQRQIQKNSEVLQLLVANPTIQSRLIACCERLCVKHAEELMVDEETRGGPDECQLLYILRFLYDEDVLDEETILKWNQSKLRDEFTFTDLPTDKLKELRDAAKPLITWLEQAEEEADEDDDDDDDDEDEDDDDDESEDDFDIDDI